MAYQSSSSDLEQPMMDLQVDISGKVEGLPGSIHLAASLYLPPVSVLERHTALPFLVLAHGGTYTRKYWDLIVPGYPRDAYSCALYLAQRGNIVVTFDLPGVGASQNGLDGHHLTTAMASDGLVIASESIRQQLAAGTLLGGRPLALASSALIGHSMGAYLSVLAQYRHRAFDALIVQSHTCGQMTIDSDGFSQLPTDANGYISIPRSAVHQSLHGSFPPPGEVIAADDQLAVDTPVHLFMEGVRSIPREWAAQIDVPVLITFSREDMVMKPYEETDYYTASPSRRFYIQPEAAHCGNFAGTRQQLWRVLADFLPLNCEMIFTGYPDLRQ